MRLNPARWMILFAVLCVMVIVVGFLKWRSGHVARTSAMTERVWPQLARAEVSVEVFNSGGVPGAARAGTNLLRSAGLDVQLSGNAPPPLAGRDRNQVLVRRGDTVGVGRVVEALGDAEVIVAPDAARLVDLTVLLGKQFKVPKVTP